jgi:predicted nucleotide-binding protein
MKTDLEQIKNLISNQEILRDCEEVVATELANVSEFVEPKDGESFVTQGDQTNDLYLILSGKVLVEINGRQKSIREFGTHVGEMAIVNPGAPRSATLRSTANTTLAKISEKNFCRIANAHPTLWKNIAKILAKRLLERNKYERQRNALPRIFMASSKENLDDLERMKTALEKIAKDNNTAFDVELWTSDEIFYPSSVTIEALEREAKLSDFAVMLFKADDHLKLRDQDFSAVRDNVIFELGLFMGAVNRDRVFIARSSDQENVRIPTDLSGITSLYIGADSFEIVCQKIAKVVLKNGQI